MQDSDSRWEGFDIPLTETDSRQKKRVCWSMMEERREKQRRGRGGRRKEFLCRWEEGMRGWVWKSSGLGLAFWG